MTSSQETFQVSVEQAEAYESMFVPALFGDWAEPLVEAAGVRPGHRVLDVACGTGVVARAAADRVDRQGSVVGVDINDGMLEVARRLRPQLEWRRADAADLPFADDSFDVVLCQAALMFFPDRVAALREIARVTTAGGTVGLHVWAGLPAQAGYGPLTEIAARHAGPEAVNLLGSYWVLGDLDFMAQLAAAAGLRVHEARTRTGTARFASIDHLVETEVKSTPLGERIDDDVYQRIVDDARDELRPFVTVTGAVQLPIAGHLITARPA
ncbi:MAG TPA: methyltransferase domain-containing protein [Jiangellaceae bacterium]